MLFKAWGLLILIVSSLVSPLALSQPDDGLLITRLSNEQWRIRLLSGTEPQQFSGTVDSSMPLASVTAIRAEDADKALLTSPSSLSTMLAAWPGRFDGVDFAVSADATLCLRDTGGTGVKLYLGETLEAAVPVQAPVALAGADGCGAAASPTNTATTRPTTTSASASPEASLSKSTSLATTSLNSTSLATATTLATSSTSLAGGRKFHPGHYIALIRGQDSQKIMAASIKSGVTGFLKRYTWRSLEPSLGRYAFAEIQSDLYWAQSRGMRLIVMIEDKTFRVERPNPAYLDRYTPRNRAGGYTMVRWAPYVVGRMNALTRALGARFDTNSSFEGIATQETSLGFDDSTLNAYSYTPEKYRDAYINILSTAANNMPRSRVFWYQNFLVRNQEYIGRIATAVAAKGVIMGGPDVLPDNNSLVTKSYPYYDKMKGKMHLFSQVEAMCYSARHETSGYRTKYWTMSELFRYARDDLHVNYMIWVRVPSPSPSDAYDWLDAVPVIGNNPTFN